MKLAVGVGDRVQGLMGLVVWAAMVVGAAWKWGTMGLVVGIWAGAIVVAILVCMLDVFCYWEEYRTGKRQRY